MIICSQPFSGSGEFCGLGKWKYMEQKHLFRLNNHEDVDKAEKKKKSPAFLSWLLSCQYTSVTVSIVCCFLPLFDPTSNLHTQIPLIAIWKHSVPRLCPKFLPLLPLLPSSKVLSFILPRKPASSSPYTTQIAQQHGRDDLVSSSSLHCHKRQGGTRVSPAQSLHLWAEYDQCTGSQGNI